MGFISDDVKALKSQVWALKMSGKDHRKAVRKLRSEVKILKGMIRMMSRGGRRRSILLQMKAESTQAFFFILISRSQPAWRWFFHTWKLNEWVAKMMGLGISVFPSKSYGYFLGGGLKYFLFSSLFGEMIQFDEHIFQMGWFNHQLVFGYCDFEDSWSHRTQFISGQSIATKQPRPTWKMIVS